MNEEVKPQLISEADKKVAALLSRIPVVKALIALFTFGVVFLAIEGYFIWRILSQEGLNRLVTTNGAVVIIGGLLWAATFTLVFVWPMKILSIEGLRVTYQMHQGMEEAKNWATQTLKPMIDQLQNLMKDAMELRPFFEDAKKVMSDVKEVVSAFKSRDFTKVEKTLEAIEKAIGNNGDLSQALQGVATLKDQFKAGVDEFRAVAKFFTEMQGKIDNPAFKAKVAHAAKTLDALAEYLDLKVS